MTQGRTNPIAFLIAKLRIAFQASSTGNVIALLALLVGFPSSIVGYLSWRNYHPSPVTKLTAPSTESTSTATPFFGNASSPQAAATDYLPAADTPQRQTTSERVVIVPAPAIDRSSRQEIDETKPAVSLRNSRWPSIKLGELVEWETTAENGGRAVEVAIGSSIALEDQDGPGDWLTCKRRPEEMSHTEIKDLPLTRIHRSPGRVSNNDFEKFRNGVPFVMSVNYCYTDPLTKKKYETMVCMKYYIDHHEACAYGNYQDKPRA
jgi:hypothetical protein